MTPDPKPLSDTEIEQMFREWWAQSWPTPPGTHALRTHIAWATHLLDKINELTRRTESDDWKALCEELVNHLQGRKDCEIGWPGEDPEQDLIDRARTLLAQSEPEDDVAQLRAALHATAAQRRAEDDARAALAAEATITRQPEFPGQVVWQQGSTLGIAPDEATARADAAACREVQ